MRTRLLIGLLLLTFSALSAETVVLAGGAPARKPLSPGEEAALRALVMAVDSAQAVRPEDRSVPDLAWDIHVLKARNLSGYLPFTIALEHATDPFASGAMYVRAVRRTEGQRAPDQHSVLRDWLVNPKGSAPGVNELSSLNAADMPIGGPAVRSARRSVSTAVQSSTLLALQEKAAAKEKADAKVYPFESYYFFDMTKSRTDSPRRIQRALSLPAGEYDVFVALLDRGRRDAAPTVLSRTVSIPNFKAGELELGSLMLVNGLRSIDAPLKSDEQIERPYAFGGSELVPVTPPSFASADNLLVVFQICNYGAPESRLTVDYGFYQMVDGKRRFFNRTDPQELTDADLPVAPPSDTQTFVMQAMLLTPFPPGRYELEVVVLDHVTQMLKKSSIEFVVL